MCVRLENHYSSFSCVMSHPQSLWSDVPYFPHSATQSLSAFPRTVLNNHTIHGQKDSLVDWLNKVLSQVMSPTPLLRLAVQRLHLFSHHQGEQVSVRCIIRVRTSQLRLCHRKSMRDKTWRMLASLLLTQKREASAPPCNKLALKKRKFYLTFKAHGDLLRCTHTNGNRAETQETHWRHIPQEKEYGPSMKKLGIT